MTILEINEILVKYNALVNLLDTVIGIVIGVLLYLVASRANSIAESNIQIAKQDKENQEYKIRSDERKVFHSVYDKLSNAIKLTIQKARVTEESKALFWQARDQARLEMPDDIQTYTQNLFDKMHKAYLLEFKLESMKEIEERKKIAEEKMNLISELVEERPHDIFSKYLKISTQNSKKSP